MLEEKEVTVDRVRPSKSAKYKLLPTFFDGEAGRCGPLAALAGAGLYQVEYHEQEHPYDGHDATATVKLTQLSAPPSRRVKAVSCFGV